MTPVTLQSPNYRKLRLELLATPKSVAVFFDNELACLLEHSVQGRYLSVYLLGEALLRSWLYAGHPAGNGILQKAYKYLSSPLVTNFQDRILRHANAFKRAAISTRELNSDNIGLDEQDSKIWQFMLERIQGYCGADGLIPVINPASPSETLLLPFKVFPGATQSREVLDISRRIIGNWGNHIQTVHHLFDYQPRIVLSCHCGRRADLIEGSSMILPICMAMARRNGTLRDFAIWDVVATGALTADGTLEPVGGLPGKAAIAQRVGARLFICPDTHTEDGIDTLPIPSHTPLAECFRLIDDAVADRGLSNLDTRQALVKLKELKSNIHEGVLGLKEASKRLIRYESILSQADPPDEYSLEGRTVALIIRGTVSNHAGDPASAKAFLAEALDWIDKHNLDPMLYCDSVANSVVSLTDLGLLDDAETEGRQLLSSVEKLRAGTSTKIRARMIANGVLGGQPLLQKALLSPDAASESLELLEAAYTLALKQSDQKKDPARDAVQIALWYALLSPQKAETEIKIAFDILEKQYANGTSSLPYLQSYRFLAAYRQLLLHNTMIPGFDSWPLPEDGPDWVRAVALKYRGTLHAGAGNIEQAGQDFQQAFMKLDSTNMPLLRFIGATIALQAAQSLKESRPETSRKYATKALALFKALETVLYGIHRNPAWQASARALIEQTYTVESPQKYYRY